MKKHFDYDFAGLGYASMVERVACGPWNMPSTDCEHSRYMAADHSVWLKSYERDLAAVSGNPDGEGW